jgi:hypothetical protein
MVLDFLKGNVAELEINLDRQTYQPGDLLHGAGNLARQSVDGHRAGGPAAA